jgi:hypothetical protein
MTIRLFYEKSKPEMPWTLKIDEPGKGIAHYGASHVHFLVPVQTEENPGCGQPQCFFIKAEGKIRWTGTVATIVKEIP